MARHPPGIVTARRFYLRQAAILALSASALLAVFETGNLDRWFSDRFYDATARGFPLRHDWFLEVVMHHWAKYLLIALALTALAGVVASFRFAVLRPLRRPLLFVVLAMALGSAAVGALKTVTNRHCPYDLDIYGASVPYARLLEAPAVDTPRGECFPGGHASGGFGLMALYLVWYRDRQRFARAALVVGFLYGFGLGFGRLMQGAHFLSHNLWAALVCWAVALLLYRAILHREHFASAQKNGRPGRPFSVAAVAPDPNPSHPPTP